MAGVLDRVEAGTALAALHAAIDDLAAAELSGLTDEQLLEHARGLERARRAAAALDVPLVAELEARRLPDRLLAASTARLLAGLWRASISDTTRRVTAGRALATRSTLTGQPLPADRPLLAFAATEGAIGPEHLHVALSTLDKLPAALPVTDVEAAEAILTDAARRVDPTVLARIGRRLRDTLDPDGAYTEEADQQRRRSLSLVEAADGMTLIRGELDPVTGALARTVLEALAAPRPSTEHGRDDRTAGQRRHDALRQVLTLATRAGDLPQTGGLPATILVTMTAEQFETGTGLALTSFGQQLSVPQALRLADQASIGWLVHTTQGGILGYGRGRRAASAGQALALAGRDRGCAFPGCDVPIEWTERHHITPWRAGGRTDLENLVSLCNFHHDRHEADGWTIHIRDGVPWFTPPSWIDPERKPRRHERFTPLPDTVPDKPPDKPPGPTSDKPPD